MKTKNYIWAIATAGLCLFTACDDEDYRDPSAIVGDYISEYRELLISAEDGWRFDYYPNEDAYGAFTFMMKFREDGRVEMQTDENFYYLFDEERGDYTKQESDYTIQNSQGPVLTFATYSLLSKLADPELFNNGSGWQGDNEFVLMGHSADGDTIHLKSVRAQKRCYIVRNTHDWDDYFEKLNRVIADFDRTDVANTYFRDIIIADQDTGVMTGFDMASRMGVVYYYQDKQMKADSCQMHFTPEGVELKQPIYVGNTLVRGFAYTDGHFLVNNESNSSIEMAVNGRPKMTFDVRDKVFRGRYEVEQDGEVLTESDLYFIDTNPVGSDEAWDKLWNGLKGYLYMVLIPDASGKYYVDLYDQRPDSTNQSTVVLARCGFRHTWSTVADEITFRGTDNSMSFLGTDTESGEYEFDTPLAKEFAKAIQNLYSDYLKTLFGTFSKRINCVVHPSPDGEFFYFVNKSDGSYLRIMKF